MTGNELRMCDKVSWESGHSSLGEKCLNPASFPIGQMPSFFEALARSKPVCQEMLRTILEDEYTETESELLQMA